MFKFQWIQTEFDALRAQLAREREQHSSLDRRITILFNELEASRSEWKQQATDMSRYTRMANEEVQELRDRVRVLETELLLKNQKNAGEQVGGQSDLEHSVVHDPATSAADVGILLAELRTSRKREDRDRVLQQNRMQDIWDALLELREEESQKMIKMQAQWSQLESRLLSVEHHVESKNGLFDQLSQLNKNGSIETNQYRLVVEEQMFRVWTTLEELKTRLESSEVGKKRLEDSISSQFKSIRDWTQAEIQKMCEDGIYGNVAKQKALNFSQSKMQSSNNALELLKSIDDQGLLSHSKNLEFDTNDRVAERIDEWKGQMSEGKVATALTSIESRVIDSETEILNERRMRQEQIADAILQTQTRQNALKMQMDSEICAIRVALESFERRISDAIGEIRTSNERFAQGWESNLSGWESTTQENLRSLATQLERASKDIETRCSKLEEVMRVEIRSRMKSETKMQSELEETKSVYEKKISEAKQSSENHKSHLQKQLEALGQVQQSGFKLLQEETKLLMDQTVASVGSSLEILRESVQKMAERADDDRNEAKKADKDTRDAIQLCSDRLQHEMIQQNECWLEELKKNVEKIQLQVCNAVESLTTELRKESQQRELADSEVGRACNEHTNTLVSREILLLSSRCEENIANQKDLLLVKVSDAKLEAEAKISENSTKLQENFSQALESVNKDCCSRNSICKEELSKEIESKTKHTISVCEQKLKEAMAETRQDTISKLDQLQQSMVEKIETSVDIAKSEAVDLNLEHIDRKSVV